MNIGERATALAYSQSREEVLDGATRAIEELANQPVSELVPGESVARILAAAIVRTRLNGGPGRVVTRVMDDGVRISDQIGGR